MLNGRAFLELPAKFEFPIKKTVDMFAVDFLKGLLEITSQHDVIHNNCYQSLEETAVHSALSRDHVQFVLIRVRLSEFTKIYLQTRILRGQMSKWENI
jgi:hypothetical protein